MLTLSSRRHSRAGEKRETYGSVQSRRRPPPPRVHHPPGRQERGAPDPLRHAADLRTGHRAQRSPDTRRHAAHRAAARDGRGGRTALGRRLFVPRPGDRLRLPPHGRLPPPLRPPAGFGHAHRPDAGPFRRGIHPQTGRGQDRQATPRHPLPRLPKTRGEVQLRRRRRILHGRGARAAGNVHAARRGLGDGYGQHHHGGRAGQGFHDDLQRRVRTLHPAVVPHAQPHGSEDLGHRLEPADHRGRRGARRHGTRAAARHDRGGQLHRHGRHEPLGADHPQRVVRKPGHHSRAVRPHGHPLRTARRRHPHSPAGPLQHRDVPRRFDHDHRRRPVAGAHARPAVDLPGGGHAGQRRGADPPENVRKPPLLRR